KEHDMNENDIRAAREVIAAASKGPAIWTADDKETEATARSSRCGSTPPAPSRVPASRSR
ncbi:MAG TPA: hypothetical protein VLN57_20835, partial [Xanthobacteraceae bacterium]|nr:hypothetical protein [Xanthobacteraceae bacterium]